jgi:hypothetical protein
MPVRSFGANQAISPPLATVGESTAKGKTNAHEYDQEDAERFSQKCIVYV